MAITDYFALLKKAEKGDCHAQFNVDHYYYRLREFKKHIAGVSMFINEIEFPSILEITFVNKKVAKYVKKLNIICLTN
jgi:hypothetical protein